MFLLKLTLWAVLFAIPMATSYIILDNRKRFGYIGRNILSGLMFISTSTAVFLAGRELFSRYISYSLGGIVFLGITVLLCLRATQYFKSNLIISENVTQSKNSPYFLNFTVPFLFTKISDILFQQLMVLFLIDILVKMNLSVLQIIYYFVVIFSAIHILTFKKHGLFGLYFLTFSLIGSFAFPMLILTVKGGIFYCIGIHLLSYLIGRTVFGVYYSKKERK